MTDDEFKKGVEELKEMLESLRLIRDRDRRKWLKTEIRYQLNQLMK